ncbi:hypothetical protein chiPu_0015391 [Chiloscyllium punctatum]|uniref:Uncharacterized protein n=1 Tax=Chiloscyllium punctatum TaxID=137246 RepID=A0A401T2L6_CHIPU|nr:hypothetical protein [Chiloscyllium punctatum]
MDRAPEIYEGSSARAGRAPEIYEGSSARAGRAPETYEGPTTRAGRAPEIYEGSSARAGRAPETYEDPTARAGRAPETYEGSSARTGRALETYGASSLARPRRAPEVARPYIRFPACVSLSLSLSLFGGCSKMEEVLLGASVLYPSASSIVEPRAGPPTAGCDCRGSCE